MDALVILNITKKKHSAEGKAAFTLAEECRGRLGGLKYVFQ